MGKHARIPLKLQEQRRQQLDEIRLQRRLTSEERAEADDLAAKLYQRIYRLT
jgi:hypothetical protein